MKLFRCDHCGNLLYFENTRCERCGRRVGYAPLLNRMLSLEGGPDVWTAPFVDNMQFVFCANAAHAACNWLIIHSPGTNPYCRACRHNELVPAIEQPIDLARWQSIERAKKRLMYSLLRLHLPLANRVEDPVHGLAFRFPNEELSPTPVLTGHASGTITIALKEADDAAREYRRTQFKEPYRTLLGHFRHEIGHYYWSVLVNGRSSHVEFRRLFGDENEPTYAEGLKDYYEQGAPAEWQQRYISAYATAHPWEDFAETFAHYLHIVDTTEMATAFGVHLNPKIDKTGQLAGSLSYESYDDAHIGDLVENWIPLSSLINNLNRAVGHNDAYPFVLTPEVIDKLGFVLRIVHEAGESLWTVPGPNGPIPINVPITQ